MDRHRTKQETEMNITDSEHPQTRNDGAEFETGAIMIRERSTSQVIERKFIVRPPTMDDLEESVELFDSCSKMMIGKTEASLSDVRSEWSLPEFDLEKSSRIVLTPEGKIVGYIEVWDIDALPVRVWVWGRVHPDFEGHGIGSYLMDWAEERAAQAIARVPQDLQVVIQAGSYSNYRPALQLLEDRNMTPIRHFHTMVTELNGHPPMPQFPPGITVRSMMGEEARAVIWATEDAFKDHWGYVDQPFEQEYERWLHFIRNDEEYDPSLWFLALDGEEIAGVSLCRPKSSEDPDMGWVNVLGVRRPWRKRGLGLALLQHSFAELYKLGKAKVGLGVDAGSLTGATRLYEKAGMHVIRQFNTYEKVLRPGRDVSTQSIEEGDDSGS